MLFVWVLLGMIRSFSRMGQVELLQGQERGASSHENRTRVGQQVELQLGPEEVQSEGRACCSSRIQQWQVAPRDSSR